MNRSRVIPLPDCGRRAAVTDHAIERWLERVRWSDDPDQAFELIDRLLQLGQFVLQPPDWWPFEDDRVPLTFGFVVAGDVCFVVCHRREHPGELVIATVAARGDVPEGERDYWHRRSRDRRYRVRREGRKSGGTRGPRGRDRRRRRDGLERASDSRRWPE